MLNNILTGEDKLQIKQNVIEKYNTLCQKLKSDEDQSFEKNYDFDESENSEISIEDELIVLLL